MHTAYRVHQLLKLPLTIEYIRAFDDSLLVGTREGHLLMYSVKVNAPPDIPDGGDGGDVPIKPQPQPQVQLLRTNKNFASKNKPISGIAVVPEYKILVALSDGVVSVYETEPPGFPLLHRCEETRGATAFAVDCVRQRSLTGEAAVTVRMVVAVKRRLHFFYYKNRKMLKLHEPLGLPDVARSVAWCRDSICVGFRGEYSLIKMNSKQEMCELFPTGKNQDPSITLLSDERFALGKDEQTTFIDLEGNMNLVAVQWNEVPQAIAQDSPYLLAVLSKTVEIRADEPRLHIQGGHHSVTEIWFKHSIPSQTLELPKPKFVCASRHGLAFVASNSHVWCLQMVPVNVQIPQLLTDKQFKLAEVLSNIGEGDLENRTKRVQLIQTLYAFDLFCNFKFQESMNVFFQLDIDPSHVIGLYPDLLPTVFRNQLQYPDKVPTMHGRDMENAILALVEYLTQIRHRLNGLPANKSLSSLPITEGCTVIKSKKQIMQILDTTLLKCYLKTNDALVAPLLRLPENQCHLEEAERALTRSQKYSELIIFYNTRALHKKALNLLKDHRHREDSPLKGRERTVTYLQNLGPDNFEIICEFSKWVLDEDEAVGLTIFTEDTIEAEALPRARVLEFLMAQRRSVVIPYLKHLIVEWKETNAVFHNALILQYKDYVVQKISAVGVAAPRLPGDGNGPAAVVAAETLSLSKARAELRELLLTSKVYSADLILPQFPHDCLEEERAILLGSLGRHEEALAIYLYQMRDVERAMTYCEEHFTPGSNIYTVLLQFMLRPPVGELLRTLALSDADQRPPCDVDSALKVVAEHGPKMDPAAVIKALPAATPLSSVAKFVRQGLEKKVALRHETAIVKSLMHAEHLQLQQERIAVESVKFRLDETDLCPVCHKKFTKTGVLARLPGGAIVHFACQEKVQRK